MGLKIHPYSLKLITPFRNKLQKLEDALVEQMLISAKCEKSCKMCKIVQYVQRADRLTWLTGLTGMTGLTGLTGLQRALIAQSLKL